MGMDSDFSTKEWKKNEKKSKKKSAFWKLLSHNTLIFEDYRRKFNPFPHLLMCQFNKTGPIIKLEQNIHT